MLPAPALEGALIERAVDHRYVDWSLARPVIDFPEPDRSGPDAADLSETEGPAPAPHLGPTAKIASSVAAQGVGARGGRAHRWALQQLVWEISHLPRVTACRRRRTAGEGPSVRARVGAAHFAGLQTCGSVWACPSCGERIRFKRAREIEQALQTLYDTPLHWGTMSVNDVRDRALSCPVDGRAEARTGTALMLTLAAPHKVVMDGNLRALFRENSRGYRRATSGEGWLEDKEAFGILGTIRADDATYGDDGWHAHLHVLVLVRGELTPIQCTRLRRRLYVRWSRYFTGRRARAGKRGKPGYAPWRGIVPVYRHGVHLEPLRHPTRAARYTAAVGGTVAATAPERARAATVTVRSAAAELARHDDVAASACPGRRRKGRTPFEILRDIDRAPVCNADGTRNAARERDLRLWWEWERDTHSRHAVRWSPGLKATLGVVDCDAGAATAVELALRTVYQFSRVEWWAVCGTRGAPAKVLDYAESGGEAAVRVYLERLVPAWEKRREAKTRRSASAAVTRRRARRRRTTRAAP